MSGYLPVVVYLVVIVAFAVVSLGLARLLSPSRPTAVKLQTYECGSETIGDAWAVFLFPWVLALRGLGMWGIWTMVGFLAILSLGWLYAYRERILEWQ